MYIDKCYNLYIHVYTWTNTFIYTRIFSVNNLTFQHTCAHACAFVNFCAPALCTCAPSCFALFFFKKCRTLQNKKRQISRNYWILTKTLTVFFVLNWQRRKEREWKKYYNLAKLPNRDILKLKHVTFYLSFLAFHNYHL